MPLHNPPHSGEYIRETYMEPFDLSLRHLAERLREEAPCFIAGKKNKGLFVPARLSPTATYCAQTRSTTLSPPASSGICATTQGRHQGCALAIAWYCWCALRHE